MNRDRGVCIARITGVFGLEGEVRLWLWNPHSDFLFKEPRKVELRSPNGECRSVVVKARPGAGKRVLGRIEGVDDRERARAFMGWELFVSRAELPDPGHHAWYVDDLIGSRVSTSGDRDLGELVHVHQGAPVDVWEMRGPSGTTFFPVLSEYLIKVDPPEILIEDKGVVEDAQ